MHGLHLTADLRDCPLARAEMTDPGALRTTCLEAVHAAGLQPVGELFHRFAPAPGARADSPVGITGAAVTLDVYVCNLGADNSSRAHALLASLIEAFAPARVERHALTRGEVGR